MIFCVIDRNPIPPERELRNAITCSKECANVLRAAQRKAAESRKCRHCGKPSTPEQRKQWAKWRKETGLSRVGRPPAAKEKD